MFFWSQKSELRRDVKIINAVSMPDGRIVIVHSDFMDFYGNDRGTKWTHWQARISLWRGTVIKHILGLSHYTHKSLRICLLSGNAHKLFKHADFEILTSIILLLRCKHNVSLATITISGFLLMDTFVTLLR